ncbi:MAG: hypothetical protein AAF725_14990 [Acidobacteriota bacterium]
MSTASTRQPASKKSWLAQQLSAPSSTTVVPGSRGRLARTRRSCRRLCSTWRRKARSAPPSSPSPPSGASATGRLISPASIAATARRSLTTAG